MEGIFWYKINSLTFFFGFSIWVRFGIDRANDFDAEKAVAAAATFFIYGS